MFLRLTALWPLGRTNAGHEIKYKKSQTRSPAHYKDDMLPNDINVIDKYIIFVTGPLNLVLIYVIIVEL